MRSREFWDEENSIYTSLYYYPNGRLEEEHIVHSQMQPNFDDILNPEPNHFNYFIYYEFIGPVTKDVRRLYYENGLLRSEYDNIAGTIKRCGWYNDEDGYGLWDSPYPGAYYQCRID